MRRFKWAAGAGGGCLLEMLVGAGVGCCGWALFGGRLVGWPGVAWLAAWLAVAFGLRLLCMDGVGGWRVWVNGGVSSVVAVWFGFGGGGGSFKKL